VSSGTDEIGGDLVRPGGPWLAASGLGHDRSFWALLIDVVGVSDHLPFRILGILGHFAAVLATWVLARRQLEAGDVVDFAGQVDVSVVSGPDRSVSIRCGDQDGGRLTASGPSPVA
jgi:hypothetical protein